MYSTIRFVGGPWHNRFEDCELVPRVIVRRALPTTKLSMSHAGCFAAAKIQEDTYYLARYETLMRTEYYQYIHSTLVQGCTAASSTYRERLPKWRISRREFEAKIKRALDRCLAERTSPLPPESGPSPSAHP